MSPSSQKKNPPIAGPSVEGLKQPHFKPAKASLQHTHSVAPHAGQSRCPKVHATASMTRRTRAVRLARPPGMVTAGTSVEERLTEPTRLTLDRKSTRLNSSHRCISYA